MEKYTGGYLCGDVRLETNGAPLRVGVCHCLDCRKHHGAVFYAAADFPKDAVTVTGKTNKYKGRAYCVSCGSSVFAKSDDEIEVHLGTLDEAGQLTPTYELWVIRREPWVPAIPSARQYDRDRDGEDLGENAP